MKLLTGTAMILILALIIGGAVLITFVVALLLIISTAVEQFEKASNTLRREDEDE